MYSASVVDMATNGCFLEHHETGPPYLYVLVGKNQVCREAQYHHHDPVDISTTNALIEDRTKGGDSLRCNLLLANGIQKLLWFQILRHR